MRKYLFSLLLSLFGMNAALASETIDYVSAEKYIIECATDWANSVVTGDATRKKIYFAEDFQGTGEDGSRYDKAAVTKDREPSEEFVSNIIGPIEVRFFGNTAIAYGEETWTKTNGETGRWIWTDIWLYRDGQWQIVAAQDNEVVADEK